MADELEAAGAGPAPEPEGESVPDGRESPPLPVHLQGYSAILRDLNPADEGANPQEWMEFAVRRYFDTYGADSVLVVDTAKDLVVPVPMGHLLATCTRVGVDGEIQLGPASTVKVNDMVSAVASLVVNSEFPIRCVILDGNKPIRGLTFRNGMAEAAEGE